MLRNTLALVLLAGFVATTDARAEVFLILAEPGSGAMHITRAFALALHRPAVEIDLSVPDLAAAGLDDLANCLAVYPSPVAVFDRVDKLSSQDAPVLATALRNNGFIEDGDRQRVPTRGALFLLIATARARETRALAAGCRSAAERTARLKAALEGAVPADLLERVDAVVHLGGPDAITLAALVVERLYEREVASLCGQALDTSRLGWVTWTDAYRTLYGRGIRHVNECRAVLNLPESEAGSSVAQ